MRGGGIPNPFPFVGAVAATDIFTTKVAGDTQNRFVLNADGSMEWGSGSASADLKAYRDTVNPGNLIVEQPGLGSAGVRLNGASGSLRVIVAATGGVSRWAFGGSTTAEGGANSGTNFLITSYDDAGAFIRNDLNIVRSTGTWSVGGFVGPATDNASDLGINDANRWRKLHLGSACVTKGSGTGLTVQYSGEVRRLTYSCITTYLAFAAAAVTADKVIATLPAKGRIVAVYADTTTKYIGGAVATCTLRLGSTAGGVEVLASHDVFTAAVTKGLADADLGTSMVRAAAVQGGYMPSFTGSTALTARITTTGANTNALTQGSTTWWIETEVLNT